MNTLNKEKNVRGTFFQRVHISKDPSHFVVIYEDGAALGGLLIAGIGVFIGSHFNLPVADGIASIVIGLLLAFVAVLLTIESRDLLLGESMQSYEVDNIMKIVKQEKNVVDLLRPLSMHMSPNDILLALDVQFNPEINSTELLKTIKRLENSIQKVYPAIKRIYVEATNLTEEVPKSDLE